MNGDLTITANGAYDDDGPLMPAAAAAVLVAWLEEEGATLQLNANDHVITDLNAMHDMNFERADSISRAVLHLRDEIRQILRGRRRVH